MARTVILDEIHLTIRVPRSLSNRQLEIVRLRLASTPFMTRLTRAIRAIVRTYPVLAPVSLTVSR
jgi:hypothetical protein